MGLQWWVGGGGREDPGTGWRCVYIEGGSDGKGEKVREKVVVNTPILGWWQEERGRWSGVATYNKQLVRA